jgi:hypothetical protein
MVALRAPNGNGTVTALPYHSIGQEKFQFANLIAAQFTAVRRIVTFDPECAIIQVILEQRVNGIYCELR